MARLPRFFVEGYPQHVIQRGNNRAVIFAAEGDYHFYLEFLRDAAERFGCTIHAYVLMTNHVHLLVSAETETSVPNTLQSVGRRYVQYFNREYTRTGTLWEGRYRATVLQSERYLLTCMRYIELNPLRAAMVRHPREHPWSSYRANALGDPDELVVPHQCYRRLGRSAAVRQSTYRQLFRAQLPASDIAAIREATNKAWVLGNDRFRAQIERLSGRRAAPKPRGRPRSSE